MKTNNNNKKYFDKYDVTIEETFDGIEFTEDNNSILNTFSTEDDFLNYDEDTREYILDTFEGNEIRVLKSLVKYYDEDFEKVANVISNGNIYIISNAWFETSREWIDELIELADEFELLPTDEDIFEEYFEKHETYDEDEAGEYYEDFKYNLLKNKVEDLFKYDFITLSIECGLMLLRNDI